MAFQKGNSLGGRKVGSVDKINEAWKVASEEMYKAQADGQAGAEQPADPEAADQSADVEDVDFEEVK